MRAQLQQVSDQLDMYKSKLRAQPSVQQAFNWYASLPKRDQLIVKAVSGLLAVALVFVLFYAPLLKSKKTAQSQLDRHLATYNLIASNAGRFGGASTEANLSGSILSATTSLAQQQGVNLSRYEQDGSNLRVWLDKVAFDEAIAWFEALKTQRGVRVSQVSIDKTNRVGRVDVRATLSR